MSITDTNSAPVMGFRPTAPILVLSLTVAAVAELIGSVTLGLGKGAVVIFPMVWGLVIAVVISVQRWRPLGVGLQKAASSIVATAVLVLIARLAFNIGSSLSLLRDVGPALALQELGHLLGTVGLALPLAVLLKMGRSAVGATFSLDREPSFAMVGERYGQDSEQYRGVLAMYVFGTLFGAAYITILASFIASMGWFDPLALAMGAGVGSGSMMAAATASIASSYPDQVQGITAVAAVSNLLTTVLGVYVGLYVALPLAQRIYDALTRGRDNAPEAPQPETPDAAQFVRNAMASLVPVSVPLAVALPGVTVIGIVTASVSGGAFAWSIVWAYLAMDVLVIVSVGLSRLTRIISPIIYITTLGTLISSPVSPVADALAPAVKSVGFLSVATVVLTTAGLSLGKDLPLLRSIGWRIIPTGLVAITTSFLFASVIAEFTLGLW